ncbi:hypothetical protein [Sphingobacterium sp. UBA7249]|uniref:hypothetical protein n=1 Tax=Sphingobacterium sp. UBA7249 TaxID=1947516 RepID=UPI0025DBB8FE|nr:hypothetical protein [Sphingobacterium sp. UBA7249]
MIKNLLYPAALFLLLTSCAKDDPFAPEQHDQKIVISPSNGNPGLGDSQEEPLGAALTLPQGIRIVERKYHPFDPDLRKLYAHANFFYVDINFVNDRMPGTPPVTVELPAGLIGVSSIHDKQNGLSIEKYLITVPPTKRYGGGRDTTTVYIGMACVNKNRSMPWYDNIGAEQVYPISRNNYPKFIVTSDPSLLKLLDLLKGHPGLKVNAHWDPVAAHEEDYVVPQWMKIHNQIQDVIWDITDGFGLTLGRMTELMEKLKPYR